MDTPLVKRAYNLGLKAVPNFLTLTEEQIQYYEKNLDKIPTAIARGFIIPAKENIIEPTRAWCEEGDTIYFSVTSDGITGKKWISRLLEQGYHVDDMAKSILLSKDFEPTKGVTTKVAVIKGVSFLGMERNVKRMRLEAKMRKLKSPNAEIACLIREKFTDDEIEAMGFCWITAMHEPIKNSRGEPCLLKANRGDGGCVLNAYPVDPERRWFYTSGFAFVVS